ncbi:hypothetical protein CLAVI_000306 [Candidatus Clavichlamydia salmonicola]|uniref:hypothetical protein n=1 Tax=Candidatus Clavichlamydia salmonicola TaxID=469812 RepID=UPI001891C77B|nr:hypothetical protein [Candidatus Clavichlamydia salmonicola]MBF5050691.1 hypothetical protein [Candidatus Clavichlamydia salmonicola]
MPLKGNKPIIKLGNAREYGCLKELNLMPLSSFVLKVQISLKEAMIEKLLSLAVSSVQGLKRKHKDSKSIE